MTLQPTPDVPFCARRLTHHDHFAFVDSRKLTIGERAAGQLMEEGPSFLDDVAEGHLPPVSWIDPRFKDLLLDTDTPTRETIADHGPLAERMTAWRNRLADARYQDPTSLSGPPKPLTEYQAGFYEMARLLRHAGLPGGHP